MKKLTVSVICIALMLLFGGCVQNIPVEEKSEPPQETSSPVQEKIVLLHGNNVWKEISDVNTVSQVKTILGNANWQSMMVCYPSKEVSRELTLQTSDGAYTLVCFHSNSILAITGRDSAGSGNTKTSFPPENGLIGLLGIDVKDFKDDPFTAEYKVMNAVKQEMTARGWSTAEGYGNCRVDYKNGEIAYHLLDGGNSETPSYGTHYEVSFESNMNLSGSPLYIVDADTFQVLGFVPAA